MSSMSSSWLICCRLSSLGRGERGLSVKSDVVAKWILESFISDWSVAIYMKTDEISAQTDELLYSDVSFATTEDWLRWLTGLPDIEKHLILHTDSVCGSCTSLARSWPSANTASGITPTRRQRNTALSELRVMWTTQTRLLGVITTEIQAAVLISKDTGWFRSVMKMKPRLFTGISKHVGPYAAFGMTSLPKRGKATPIVDVLTGHIHFLKRK